MRNGIPSNKGGFTLIEILVALAILGAGLFLLMETHYNSMNLFSEAQESVTFSVLLERIAGQIDAEVISGIEEGEGDFGDVYPGYVWSYTSEPVDEETFPGLLQVQITITGPEETREIEFLTYDGIQVDV